MTAAEFRSPAYSSILHQKKSPVNGVQDLNAGKALRTDASSSTNQREAENGFISSILIPPARSGSGGLSEDSCKPGAETPPERSTGLKVDATIPNLITITTGSSHSAVKARKRKADTLDGERSAMQEDLDVNLSDLKKPRTEIKKTQRQSRSNSEGSDGFLAFLDTSNVDALDPAVKYLEPFRKPLEAAKHRKAPAKLNLKRQPQSKKVTDQEDRGVLPELLTRCVQAKVDSVRRFISSKRTTLVPRTGATGEFLHISECDLTAALMAMSTDYEFNQPRVVVSSDIEEAIEARFQRRERGVLLEWVAINAKICSDFEEQLQKKLFGTGLGDVSLIETELEMMFHKRQGVCQWRGCDGVSETLNAELADEATELNRLFYGNMERERVYEDAIKVIAARDGVRIRQPLATAAAKTQSSGKYVPAQKHKEVEEIGRSGVCPAPAREE